jgi:hypothetical protein
LCASQRSADDDEPRLTGRLVLSHFAHDDVAAARLVGLLLELDEEENGVGLFLLTSHLSHDDARLVLLLLLLLLLLPSEELLHASHLSTASAQLGFGGDLIGVLLHASHLSTASARLSFGGEGVGIVMAAAQGGVGSSGSIFHSGGVGSSPGMAACAIARCTRATVTAMDAGWIEGAALRVREEIPLYSYTNTSEQAARKRGDGMRLMAHAVLYLKCHKTTFTGYVCWLPNNKQSSVKVVVMVPNIKSTRAHATGPGNPVELGRDDLLMFH